MTDIIRKLKEMAERLGLLPTPPRVPVRVPAPRPRGPFYGRGPRR